MRDLIRLIAIAALLGVSGSVTTEVAAQDETSLRGYLFIVTPGGEPPHVQMTIKGEAALKMYHAMKAAEVKDECRGNGWRMKAAGPLLCSISANRKDAECLFTVDLVSGRLGGVPC
jgi:hypothetical protein